MDSGGFIILQAESTPLGQRKVMQVASKEVQLHWEKSFNTEKQISEGSTLDGEHIWNRSHAGQS